MSGWNEFKKRTREEQLETLYRDSLEDVGKEPKEYSNYHTIALISHASKVTFKLLQTRLQ